MTRDQCLDVLEAFQRADASVIEFQDHQKAGSISAASPWVIRSKDINGLPVEMTDYLIALKWLQAYWIPRKAERDNPTD